MTKIIYFWRIIFSAKVFYSNEKIDMRDTKIDTVTNFDRELLS